jgi:hypothetical protein
MFVKTFRFRRLVALLGLLTMAFAGVFGNVPDAGAQINPCLGPTIPPVFIPAPTEEPTETPFPITDDPTETPTETPFPITDDPTEIIIPQGADGSGDASSLAFSQRVDDNKTSLPTSTPDCDEDEPDPTSTPVRDEDDDPTPTPDFCNDGPVLTPVDPTATATATDEPTVTPSPTDEPTVTPSPTDEPTAIPTDPIPGFINDTLAFAQEDECDPGDDGGDDDGGDDGIYELPKTGTGESGGLQTVIVFGAMAAGLVLLCAGFASARRKA